MAPTGYVANGTHGEKSPVVYLLRIHSEVLILSLV